MLRNRNFGGVLVGMQNGAASKKIVWLFHKKFKTELEYDTGIPLLGFIHKN